jgi:xylulokinase
LVGGGAKSLIWPQIFADVLGCEVQVVDAPGDAAARGAAILAGVSLGWYAGYTPAATFFPIAQRYTPQAKHTQRYTQLYAVFYGLYPQLRGAFAELADLTTEA